MRRMVLLCPVRLPRGLFAIALLAAGGFALQGCSSLENPLPAVGSFVSDTFSGTGTMFGNPTAGMGNFLGDTISFNTNPNRPVGDAPNVQRVMGKGYEPEPLLPEPGNVWPGPLPEPKTLSDLQKEGTLGSADPAPAAAPVVAPRPVPRASAAPVAAPIGTAPTIPTPRGRVLQTPAGPGVTTMGPNGIETIMLPNGQQGTVMQNQNGTANILMPDGRSFSVPYPR